MSLGERMREARKIAGITQEDLAKLMHLNSSKVISTWENDKNKPDIEKLQLFCKLLNLPYEWIFDADEPSRYDHKDIEFFVGFSELDQIGKWVVSYNLEQQIKRCGKRVGKKHAKNQKEDAGFDLNS